MKNCKWIFKIAAAIFIISAAVTTIVIFKEELTDLLDSAKQKINEKKYCKSDFVDFDDV